jgi:hypothetical protein
MKYFPLADHDDGLDALEMLVNISKKGISWFDIPNEAYDQILRDLQQQYYFRRFYGYY